VLAGLEPELDAVAGTVSVWCGPVGADRPWYARAEHVPHYAASTMKIAVLAAAHHAHEAGIVDLDTPVPVTDRFRSAAPGAPGYRLRRAADDDPAVWDRLGGTATLRWLAERMIVRSSNLATNLVLDRVGIAAADAEWRHVGARSSRIGRGIEDVAAAAAGITNQVTAADLAALLSGLVLRAEHGPLAVLQAQEQRDDLPAGLPPGTRVAHKSGWVRGVRHGAAVVYPAGRPRYTLVVCTTSALPDAAACRLLARVAAASWARSVEQPAA
jgi:beta-lactamase class A